MAEIKNLNQLVAKLDSRLANAMRDSEQEAVVGYTASYALYVHENMEIWPPGMRLKGLPRGLGFRRNPKTGIVSVPSGVLSGGTVGGDHHGFYWDPQGKAQPKFLEHPARVLSANGVLGRIILQVWTASKSMAQALYAAGLRLQRESMELVPVDTGNLRASAFTRMERTR